MLLDLEDALPSGACGSSAASSARDLFLYRGSIANQVLTIKRVARNQDREAAERIINRLYGWRGYGDNHKLREHASRSTFIAHIGDESLGTISLTVDSPEKLAVDVSFPEEVEHLRGTPHTRLCELSKFAFDPSPRSRPMLALLFHVIFVYGTQRHDCTDILIEVNPRHVRFYESSLGFKRVGSLRTNVAVNAPSQLMQLAVNQIDENIRLFGGHNAGRGHSLYQHFLGQNDARALRQRIVELTTLEDCYQHCRDDLAKTKGGYRSGRSYVSRAASESLQVA